MFGLLPDEIRNIIFDFLPPSVLLRLNRDYYIQYHPICKEQIPLRFYENYIRNMVRQDCDFIFSLLLQENANRWIGIKKYVYKSTCFANYIYFLKDFCIEHDSPRCRGVLRAFLDETGLSKNLHKKNTAISIRWK